MDRSGNRLMGPNNYENSGRQERRATLKCYQDAPPDTPERAEEDRLIELVHSNTREEVDDAVMARLNIDTKIVSTEQFFQVLSQIEEVQDMEGIIYNSGLITKFMDDKFAYEALTLRGCHVVIGMFINQARKHSERLKKESSKTVVATKAKYLGTWAYLKLIFTCKLRDGRHDYRWKGIPSMSSKSALMVIVLLVTVVACVALIAVLATVNAYMIDSSIEVAKRLTATVGAMDGFVESTIREMQYEYSYTAADMAKITATSVSQFDEVLDALRRTAATSGDSTMSMILDDAIMAGLAPVEDFFFGMWVLKYDIAADEATLTAFLVDFNTTWHTEPANSTRYTSRTGLKYPIDMIVYNKDTNAIMFGDYTVAQALAMGCIQKPLDPQRHVSAMETTFQTSEVSKSGAPAATLSTLLDSNIAFCAVVETSHLIDYVYTLVADKLIIPNHGTYSTSAIVYDPVNATYYQIANSGSTMYALPAYLAATLAPLQPGGNMSYVFREYMGGAYMFASPYFPQRFIYTVSQIIDINAVGGVASVHEDGSITTLLAGPNPDPNAYDRYITYGEPTARAPSGLPAIALALSGRSGAIFNTGYRGRECLTMYYPLRLSNVYDQHYAVLIERDLTDLRKELRSNFLAKAISDHSSHHEMEQFFIKRGRVRHASGDVVGNAAHHDFLLECFYARGQLCRTIMGDEMCCNYIDEENSVIQLRLMSSYMMKMVALAAYTLIAVAVIACIAIGSIRLLTRLVLDHIEKDYEGYREQIEKEKTQFSELVKDVMPSYISKRIMAGEKLIVDQHPQLTFLFSDIVSFTEKSRKLSTTQMVRMLGYMFMVEDGCAEYYGIHKIKTIGDAYFCVSGLEDAGRKDGAHVRESDATTIDSSHHEHGDGISRSNEVGRPEDNQVYRMVAFATTVQLLLSKDYTHYPERTECFADLAGNDATGALKMMSMRMGIHSGPAIAGVVDVGRAPQFDCLGPSVNLASRMESTAMVDRIQLSNITYDFLRACDVNNVFEFEEPKKTLVKGYGTIKTYHIRSTTLAVPEVLIKALRIDRATRRRFFSENGILQETGNETASISRSQSSASHQSASEDNNMAARDDYEVQPIRGVDQVGPEMGGMNNGGGMGAYGGYGGNPSGMGGGMMGGGYPNGNGMMAPPMGNGMGGGMGMGMGGGMMGSGGGYSGGMGMGNMASNPHAVPDNMLSFQQRDNLFGELPPVPEPP